VFRGIFSFFGFFLLSLSASSIEREFEWHEGWTGVISDREECEFDSIRNALNHSCVSEFNSIAEKLTQDRFRISKKGLATRRDIEKVVLLLHSEEALSFYERLYSKYAQSFTRSASVLSPLPDNLSGMDAMVQRAEEKEASGFSDLAYLLSSKVFGSDKPAVYCGLLKGSFRGYASQFSSVNQVVFVLICREAQKKEMDWQGTESAAETELREKLDSEAPFRVEVVLRVPRTEDGSLPEFVPRDSLAITAEYRIRGNKSAVVGSTKYWNYQLYSIESKFDLRFATEPILKTVLQYETLPKEKLNSYLNKVPYYFETETGFCDALGSFIVKELNASQKNCQ